MRCTDKIPGKYIAIWHGILCRTGGYYITNPRILGDEVWVEYTPGDYKRLHEEYAKAIAPIVEIKASKWKLFKRRVRAII